MKARTGILACAVAGFAFVATPQFAAANPPGGCPPGLAKKGWCGKWGKEKSHWTRREDHDGERSRYRDHDHDDDREGYYRYQDRLDDAYEEGYRDGRHDAFEIGQRLDRNRYHVLDRDLYYDRYGRRLDDRYYYAEADGRQLLIEAATGVILDILSR